MYAHCTLHNNNLNDKAIDISLFDTVPLNHLQDPPDSPHTHMSHLYAHNYTISLFHSCTLSLCQTFTISLFHCFKLSLFHALQLVVDHLQDPPHSPHIHMSHLYAHITWVSGGKSALGSEHTSPYNPYTTQDTSTKPVKVGDHKGTTSRRSTVDH